MANFQIPWRRLILIAFGALVSYLLVPIIFSRYNEIKSVREARRARAIRFGDRNDEFNDKISDLASLMPAFNGHAHRVKLSAIEVKEADKELNTKHLERSLDMGDIWWWPQDFQREVGALALLSPDELKQLSSYVNDYNASLAAALDAPKELWHFVDSVDYRVDDASQKKIDTMTAEMYKKIQTEDTIRADLVEKISILFAKSNFRTGTLNMLGL